MLRFMSKTKRIISTYFIYVLVSILFEQFLHFLWCSWSMDEELSQGKTKFKWKNK